MEMIDNDKDKSKNLKGSVLSATDDVFIRQMEQAEAGVSDSDNPEAVDLVKSYISTLQANPEGNIRPQDMLFDYKNITGIEINGKKKGLLWTMNASNDYYKAMYPNLTDDMLDGMRELYTGWQSLYNTGEIGNYATGNADGKNLSHVMHSMYGMNTISNVKFTHNVNPNTSAQMKDYYLDADGNIQSGSPAIRDFAPSGKSGYSYPLTVLQQDPYGDGYVYRVIDTKDKTTHGLATTMPIGGEMFIYRPRQTASRLLEKGKYFTYVDSDGVEKEVKSIIIDENGDRYTTNRFLGGQKEYDDYDLKEALDLKDVLEKQFGGSYGDLGAATFTVWSDKDAISVKQHKQPTYYKDRNSFMSWVGHSFKESYFDMYSWIGNMIFDSKKWDDIYYENLMRKYQNPVGIPSITESPYYNRNIAEMTGDLLAQMLPSIMTAGMTGAISAGGIALKATQVGSKAVAKGVVKNTVKATAKATVKKQAVNQGVRSGVFLGREGGMLMVKQPLKQTVIKQHGKRWLRTASWSVPAAGQSGFGTYREGLESGVVDHDAAGISLLAAAITLGTSRLLEPTWIRSGMFVKLDKNVVNSTVNNLVSKMGLQVVTKEGRSKFVRNGITELLKNVQGKGVGAWSLELGLNAFMEGAQEYVEGTMIGWTQMIYNKYNRGDYSKRVGEGLYDVDGFFSADSSEFILGSLMGFGASVIPSMTTLGSAIRYSKEKRAKDDNYMLYSLFAAKGTDKVVKEFQSNILQRRANGQLGSTNHDINGNQIKMDADGNPIGETMDISDSPFAAVLGDILRTEADMNAYNMLMEGLREAEIFDYIKGTKISQDVDSDLLISADVKNNMAVEAALAYKNVKQKRERIEAIQESLNDPNLKSEEKDKLTDELDTLTATDLRNDNTLAYWENKLDHWSKPLDTVEYDGKVLTGYKYSEGIRRSIINTSFAADKYIITKAYQLGMDVDENIAGSKGFAELFANSDRFLDILHAYHEYFGRVEPNSINVKTGKPVYNGLSGLFKAFNDRVGQIHSQETKDAADTLKNALKGKLGNIKGLIEKRRKGEIDIVSLQQAVNDELKDIFGGESLESVGKQLGWTYDGFTEALINDITDITSALGDIDSLNEAMKDTEVDDMLQEYFTIQDAISKNVTDAFQGIDSYVTEGRLEAEELTVETIEADSVQSTDDKQKLDKLFEEIKNKAISGIMLYEIAPMEDIPLMFRNYSLADLINFIDANKTSPMDMNTMLALDKAIRIYKAHMNNIGMYLWGLETLKATADTNQMLKEGHTYDNQITRRFIDERANLEMKLIDDHDKISLMYENMKKNGFSKLKEELRYQAAHLSNTNMYMTDTLYHTAIPYLTRFFDVKDGVVSLPDNLPDGTVESFLKKRIELYLEKKYPNEKERKAKLQEILKAMDDNIQDVKKVLDAYFNAVQDLMNKWYGTPQQSGNSGTVNLHDPNAVNIMLERLFSDTSQNQEKAITDFTAMMNEMYVLQWKYREQLSGKMTPFLLWTEAVAEHNDLVYKALGEHKGIKLYIPEDSTTTGNDIVYRGTFAPGDLQLGKSMLFDTVNDIQRSDYNELVNIATTRMLMTSEELKSYDSTKTEALRDALLDKIENSKVNRDTALHYIVTNMGIDNFMGGNNMTVMQCLGHIKQNVIDSLIDRMQLNGRKLSDSVAKKIRKAIVIKDGIMDEEATMKSLLDVLEDIKDIDDLGATAKMIYSSLNTAITLEQEYAVIHLVSSFYRHSDGNNMLGVLMEDKDAATLLDKSVAVLGAGGTGKSTMVLENYYYVTKQILTKERKTYNGKVIPTKKKVKILVASPTHAVNNIQEANIKKVYGDEADVVKITFHDMQSMNLNDIDIIVIDEASLIDNNKNKNAAKEDKQYSDYGVLMDMVRRVNPQHVVAIYDTNQTANMRNYSAPEITTMLGERTIPLQMRHRTGYVDLNVLSNIFSDDAYAVQCTANNGLVPLTRNGVPFNAKWKKDVNGNKKGIRITGNVSDVMQDYLDAKKTNSDGNMIIVRTAEDKANLLSKYESLGVVPEDVYILEYGDKDFNVSGRNSRNVFVIVDGKYIDKAAPTLKSDLYRLHAKMLNTAITRLRGDGYVSLYYPNGDVHSTEVEANDILLQYKNTLDIDYGVDTKEIINEFGSMAVTALRLQNNSYIRMTDPEQETPQSTTQETPQSTTQDIQQVYEDISDTMADVIEEMRSEEAIDGAKPISDKVYENISGTDEVAMNVNNIVREGLKIIYRKVQEGVLNISKFSVQPNTADFDKVYGDIIKAIAKHYATQGINMGNYTEKDILYIIHNVVLNSISDTGIQVMADMNKHTAIISPNLNVNIGGTDYVATPFMVNVVGYETNADKTLTPIFDIYELDISQSPRNNVDEVAEGNKKKAAYAIAILAAKGYKVNKVHFLNFVLTPGKRVTTTFNNRFTTDDTIFVFDGKSYESIYSSIKSEQGEEVKVEDIFADKDALLKLGVIMPLEDAERNSRYQNLKTKNVSYIVGKELKMVMGDKVVYYHLANGDVLTDVEFGHTYQRVENKEKKQYYFGATLYGHIRTPLNAIPAIAVQGQNLPQSRVEFYDHPFFKKLRGDGAYKLKGKEVKAEYHEELSFFQWDSKTESTKSVTYYNVVLYKDGDKIVGVQERLRFSNNTEATRKQLDAMVAKYVKAKDEKEASDILNDIERWLMDCEKQYSEDHSFDDSNVAYQIDKIKNIRKVAFKQGSYVVGDVSNGTHIISEIAYPLQELVGRRVNKGESIVDWEQADSNRFSVIATFMIDGRKVDIHCDAAKVDDSYIANMKTMAKDFRKRYNKILKGDEAAIGNDIARLAMEMQASELTDFLYANRERLEKVNLYDFSNKFIDFKLGNKKKVKGGKVNVKNTMANMLNQIDLAIKIADNSRKGALDMAWNKAIFMTNVLAASNETLYLNNLVSKVIDVSTPTLEITEKGADSKPPVGGASNINTKKADIKRRREELESSREIETLYDLTKPITEDSKEIISKIEEANKLRKEAKIKSKQAAKEIDEEKKIALYSDANSLNEKAQILDREIKRSRDSVINNTSIKQAIASAWSIGQKLLNKIKLTAKSNEWVSSMPISKEDFTKLEDAVKRLSVKNMGEVTSNSEVIPDILLIEEVNAKYDAELDTLNNIQQQKVDIIQTNEPTIHTVGNVTFGTANKQGQTENNEDAVYVDVESGIFILADGMGGEGMITHSPSQTSKSVINILLGKPDKNATEFLYEEYLRNKNITSDEAVAFLNKNGFNIKGVGIAIVSTIINSFKTRGDLTNKKGFRTGATALKAIKTGNNTYTIEKVGDTVYFVVDKNGKVIQSHGLSNVATTQGYMFSIKDGKPYISTPKIDRFTVTLNEGETLVLATDFIETDKAIQDFINSDFGKNLNFEEFQKNNKIDDSTFITIEYNAESESLNNQTTSQQNQTAESQSLEQQKADIEIGKVGDTEYEVKADGVYYQGKKLDNPENKTYRQLIEAHIERRKEDELYLSDPDRAMKEAELKLAKLREDNAPIEDRAEILDGIKNIKYYKENYYQEKVDKINAKYKAELEALGFKSEDYTGIGTEDLDNQVKGDPFFNNNEGNGFSVFRISKEGEAVDMSTDDNVRAATAEVQRIVGDSFVSNNLKFNERIIEEGVSREVFGKLSDNIITLSYRSGSLMPVVARHEAMHFVLYFCLSPDEYDRVMSAQRAILMREHKMRGEGTVPTDTDVLEAICEGYENYKYKPSTKPKNFLERLYYALKRFFERFMRNRRTIEKLYSRADSGFYANEALHKYNNNLLREDRYAIARGSLSNEYNSYEAVTELSNFYGGKINIIDNVLDTQLKIILNRSIETGKIVLKPKDSYREVASVYLNLISEANFEEIDGLVISYNVVEDGVTVEKELTLKELLYNNNELDVAMFTEMTTNPNIKSDIGNADLIRRLAGDITGHIYSNPKLALATLAFHYPMMERAYKGNNDMVNIYMQMLDPFIDMREMISDTERLVKQKEKHGKKIDHKMLTSSQTFNKPSGVNDHTNYKFKDMIENITYRKGKFMSNVSFSEFSSIIKKCNLIFTEDINNKFKDKIVLGYDDIMALIKSQINDGTNSKYTTQAIYSYFSNEAPKGYDKNNEESMNTFFYNEWSDNYQGFNFNNYGYGFMLQRINDYLEEGSISNKLLKDATGNFYNQVEAILIEKRAAITANVINTFVNYFNSMDVVNSHVANVDNTIVSMFNFTSSSTNKMIGDIAYNNMFEEHNENYGFTDRAKKLKKEYKINGYKDTITYKYTNGDGVVVQGKINTKLQEFSVEDVQAIERLLVAVYDNYIVSENIYNPSLQNEGKYRVNRKAVNTAIQVIDMLHTFNPALGVKSEIPLSYVSSLNQGIEVILSSTSKNAEGENVSNIKVKTPLTLALNNSGKIASLSQDMTMYNPDAVVIEQLVKEATEYTFDDTVELEDGDIEDIIDMMIDDETLIYTDENNNPCVPTVPKMEEGMRGNDFTKGSKWTMIEEFDGATHSEGGIDIKLTDRGFTFAREDGDVLAVNGLLIAKK